MNKDKIIKILPTILIVVVIVIALITTFSNMHTQSVENRKSDTEKYAETIKDPYEKEQITTWQEGGDPYSNNDDLNTSNVPKSQDQYGTYKQNIGKIQQGKGTEPLSEDQIEFDYNDYNDNDASTLKAAYDAGYASSSQFTVKYVREIVNGREKTIGYALCRQ